MTTFLSHEHTRLYLRLLEQYAHVANRMDTIDKEALSRRLFIMSKQILSEKLPSTPSLIIRIPVYNRVE